MVSDWILFITRDLRSITAPLSEKEQNSFFLESNKSNAANLKDLKQTDKIFKVINIGTLKG